MTDAAPLKSAPLVFSGGDAVVTGAASGIGAAIAHALVAAGVRTVSVDLNRPDIDTTLPAELQVGVAADVRSDDLGDVLGAAGVDAVSYLVNCAGILTATGFRGVERDLWLRSLDINLVGAYNLIDTLGPSLRTNAPSAVVNITSIEASRVIALTDPDPTPHYAASKAGLHMLTQSAARALAADGVRVNSVAPGFVATPMAAAHGDTSSLPSALAGRVPLGRFAAPTEIADAVLFLLSDQASFITGTELRVDGGFQLT